MQKGHETRTVRRRSRTIVLGIDTNRMAKLLGLINIYARPIPTHSKREKEQKREREETHIVYPPFERYCYCVALSVATAIDILCAAIFRCNVYFISSYVNISYIVVLSAKMPTCSCVHHVRINNWLLQKIAICFKSRTCTNSLNVGCALKVHASARALKHVFIDDCNETVSIVDLLDTISTCLLA